MVDSIATTVGASPQLIAWTGSPPADCAAANAGTAVVIIVLPSTWLNAASSGAASKAGTWSANAVTTNTPGHWRLFNSAGSTCHLQGSAGVGSGDMPFSAAPTSGQTVTIDTFTLTAGNA